MLRQILACAACSRQFDVGTRLPGSMLHCSCGATLTVPPPETGHEAAVVRCSSCGAPRAQTSQAGVAEDCGYCGASFDDAERQLNTLCPKCLTRIGDQARFCHSCGTAIAAESAEAAETELPCPACAEESRLRSRSLGGMAVHECGRCAGLWVDVDTLRALEDRAREIGADVLVKPTRGALDPAQLAAGGSSGGAGTGGRIYRPCPSCGTMMLRKNYGQRSGVIVDVCGQHGVFFDDEELTRVLEWVRTGGFEGERLSDRAAPTWPRQQGPRGVPTRSAPQARPAAAPMSRETWNPDVRPTTSDTDVFFGAELLAGLAGFLLGGWRKP